MGIGRFFGHCADALGTGTAINRNRCRRGGGGACCRSDRTGSVAGLFGLCHHGAKGVACVPARLGYRRSDCARTPLRGGNHAGQCHRISGGIWRFCRFDSDRRYTRNPWHIHRFPSSVRVFFSDTVGPAALDCVAQGQAEKGLTDIGEARPCRADYSANSSPCAACGNPWVLGIRSASPLAGHSFIALLPRHDLFAKSGVQEIPKQNRVVTGKQMVCQHLFAAPRRSTCSTGF